MHEHSNSLDGEGRFSAIDAESAERLRGEVAGVLTRLVIMENPDVQLDMLGSRLRQVVGIRVGKEVLVLIHGIDLLRRGNCTTEVAVHEPGKDGVQIGPRLRSYVTGDACPRVIRHGLPPEELLKTLPGKDVARLKAEEEPDTFTAASIEAAAGLTNATVHVDELDGVYERLRRSDLTTLLVLPDLQAS